MAAALLLVGLGVSSWAALSAAHLGRFNGPFAVAMGASAVVVSAWFMARRNPHLKSLSGLLGSRADLATVGLALIGAVALQPAAAPWPAFFDASWYLNTAAAITRARSLNFVPDTLAVEALRPAVISTFADQREALPAVPARADRGFHDVAFAIDDVHGAIVHPYHPPLVSASLAMAMTGLPPAPAAGSPGAGTGRIVVLWSVAYLLVAGAVARAAFGPLAAPVAVVALAAGPGFAYYGAAPFAEVPAGALVLGAVACLSRLAERIAPDRSLAFAAGLCLGLAALAKLELTTVIPMACVWWLAFRRGRGGTAEAAAFGLGLAGPLLHLTVLAFGPSRTYVELNLAGVAGLLGVAVGLTWRPPAADLPPGSVRRGFSRANAGTIAVIAGGLLVTAAALVPQTQGAPPNGAALLLWLVTPIVAWAAAAAVVVAIRRPEPTVSAVAWLTFGSALALLLLPGITTSVSPLYTARRFVPLVLPGLTILAAGAAVSTARRGGRTAFLAGAGVVLAVAALYASSRPLRMLRDFDGGVGVLSRVASHVEPDALILFPSPLNGSQSARAAAPLWTRHQLNTAVLRAPFVPPEELAAALAGWREARGTPIYFIGDELGEPPEIPGWKAEEVADEEWLAPLLSTQPTMPPGPDQLGLMFRIVRFAPEGAG